VRTVNDMHPYQHKCVEFQCSRPASALWVDPGLGKTVTTLTSVNYLLQVQHLRAVLVVAPIRVCRLVWRQEALKWEHTKDMTFGMVMGTRDQRTRSLLQDKNVFLINYENLGWLAEALHTYYIKKGKPLPFDGVVFDEISKCKNSSTDRVKSLRKILPHIKWTTGLTGTPASNGYKDLHGQFLVLDQGERLGTSKTAFRTRFYHKVGPYKEVAFDDTETTIKNLIGDMTLEMSAADYLTMPDLIVNDVMVEMEPDVRLKYDKMEREFFLRLDSGAEKEMFNQASLTNSCLQYSNGAIYPVAGDPTWERVHDQKLEALDDILEECDGKPVLLWYAYRSDAERIMARFKDYRPINLTECKTELSLKVAMTKWQDGECKLMVSHPLSAGHGVDGLQNSSHTIVWFGLNWSLDSYMQANARLHRQGQGHPVICHRIMCKDTLDQAQAIALDNKASDQVSLRNAVRSYRENK
jgi:SNF2 family DNA or RNA helicase